MLEGTENLKPRYLRFLLTIPLYQDEYDSMHSRPGEKFLGALSLIANLEGFLTTQLDLVEPEMKLHHIWILARDGWLLLRGA